jgi:hypothetical protein
MQAPTERIERPAFGAQGEPCPRCGTPMAGDQRYCLACGARRAGLPAVLSDEQRRPAVAAARPPAGAAPAAVAAADAPWRLDAGLAAGVGCLLLALLVGVLIGRSGRPDPVQRASTPQVVTLNPGAGAGGTAAPVSFTSDWPAGKRGFTVALQTLPKTGTDAAAVAAAKQAATAKGAKDVGALDSDSYPTLDPASYVVYSGQYGDRKAASAALKGLKASFPGAKVVEVRSDAGSAQASTGSGAGKAKQPSKADQAAGAAAIQGIQGATGADYSKKSAQLPDKLVTPGAPPPTDTSKPAGGGSSTETFK